MRNLVFAMAAAVLLLPFEAGATSPQEIVARDRVDLMEVSHYYDDCGNLVIAQTIFYDWCDSSCRFQVRAYRYLEQPSQVPIWNAATGCFEALWHDGDRLRYVWSPSYQETWTQHDPEQRNRKFLPWNKRRGLSTFGELTPAVEPAEPPPPPPDAEAAVVQ